MQAKFRILKCLSVAILCLAPWIGAEAETSLSPPPLFDEAFKSFSQTPNTAGGIWQTQFFWGQRTLPANQEQEYYSDSSIGPDPFSAGGHGLEITAAPKLNPSGLPYVSGMITSYPSFARVYGYWEMRARLPQGAGMWPAFWLITKDGKVGEIDIMEAFGAPYRGEGGCNQTHWGLHGAPSEPVLANWVAVSADICAGFHTYAVDWEPQTITWYFDDKQIAQTQTPSWAVRPMYMVANLAVGGSWAGPPAGETSSMMIDYIRVYAARPPASGNN